jgi:integrase
MPTRKLTDLFVERVKPPTRGRIEYFDASFGGLSLRVTDRGVKSWAVIYRAQGRLRRYTIGRYPAIKPAQARREATTALERVRQGVDPTAEKKARLATPLPVTDTFKAVLADFLQQYTRRHTAPRTYVSVKQALELDALPAWRNMPIETISRRHVIKLIDDIAARGAEVQANRVLSMLRRLFGWAVEKDRLKLSPVVGMRPPTKERSRDRALSDDELKRLLEACAIVGWPFGPIVKFLILTAQRRLEVAGLEWSEIDFATKTWTIPKHKAKNSRAHEVQLSAAAVELLESLPRVSDRLVFTTTSNTVVSGFSHGKHRLDAEMAKLGDKSLVPPWTIHDLRRTAATGMAGLRIAPHVVDKILNHVSGKISGVAAIYNRFEYSDERRAALEAWGRYVENLTTPAPTNVISIVVAR